MESCKYVILVEMSDAFAILTSGVNLSSWSKTFQTKSCQAIRDSSNPNPLTWNWFFPINEATVLFSMGQVTLNEKQNDNC